MGQVRHRGTVTMYIDGVKIGTLKDVALAWHDGRSRRDWTYNSPIYRSVNFDVVCNESHVGSCIGGGVDASVRSAFTNASASGSHSTGTHAPLVCHTQSGDDFGSPPET
jgi:hypothetical protein